MLPFLIVFLVWLPLAEPFFFAPELINSSANSLFAETQTNGSFSSLSEALADSEAFILRQIEAFNIPSLSFAISASGKTVYEKAWGYSDLENSVPATLTTKYRLCSASKTFTSALVGTLVDKGLLKYDDPISAYLPATVFPSKSWNGTPVNITLGQLLSHTAGTHYSLNSDFDTIIPESNVTQMLAKFANEPLLFAPGSSFSYSNYGFQLVGAIVETVTKKPFPEAITELFGKLGLANTFAEMPNQLINNCARYYRSTDTQRKPKENTPTLLMDELLQREAYWPSGGQLLTTVGDLLTFGNAILHSHAGKTNSIISQATLKEMWTRRTEIRPSLPWADTQYGNPNLPFKPGYGWLLSNLTASINPQLKYRQFNWHQGNLMGVTSMFMVYPTEEMVVAILTNKGYVPDLDKMANYVAENIYEFC